MIRLVRSLSRDYLEHFWPASPGSAKEEKGSRDKGTGQEEKKEEGCNRVCRFPDTVANREKKRDALMGLEEGWSHGG